MAATYAVATSLGCVVVTDNVSGNTIGLPGALLVEKFGAVLAVGNADGVADVNAASGYFVGVMGDGNADGVADVLGITGYQIAVDGNADGFASVSAVGLAVTHIGHADGIASVSGIGAFIVSPRIVGNADGQADVRAFSQTVAAVVGNADGFASVVSVVRIPGDGCALAVGL